MMEIRRRVLLGSRLSAMYSANNRAMSVVTLERADGRQIMRESIGQFPDMTPVPINNELESTE